MVNIKRVVAGILCAGAGLLVVMEAEAVLPTFDAANIAGTVSIVKNGSENLKGISDITNKVGELNTIVGDAAASVSKFQEDYGDEINKGLEIAQKAMARKAEAEAAKAEHDAEVQAQKDAYQAALDSTEDQNAEEQEEIEEVEEDTVYEEPEIAEEEIPAVGTDDVLPEDEENVTSPAMSSYNRNYNDEDDTGGENLDGISGDGENLDGVSGEDLNENEISEEIDENGLPVEPEAVSGEVSVSETADSVPLGRRPFNRPSMSGAVAAPSAVVPTLTVDGDAGDDVTVPETPTTVTPKAAVSGDEPAATPGQRRKFRVSPRLNGTTAEKVSSSTYRHSEKIGFASSSESEGVGNSYIGDVYVVPMAERCSISAEAFVKDETKRKECIETIIRENNADNSFDSALSMKDCRRMVYKAVVSLLAEATNSKYEAANYSDTLDKQDKLAANSTDVRGDLTILAMSNYQTQLLLNRISMSFSSQIILETVEQLCAARKDVLGDSDLDKASETSGEK